jgi:hypothetical protein
MKRGKKVFYFFGESDVAAYPCADAVAYHVQLYGNDQSFVCFKHNYELLEIYRGRYLTLKIPMLKTNTY